MHSSTIVLFVLFFFASAAPNHLKVILDVFSGVENPSWDIKGSLAHEILHSISSDPQVARYQYAPKWPLFGYRGLKVLVSEKRGFHIYGNEPLERALLSSAPRGLVAEDVVEMCFDEMHERSNGHSSPEPLRPKLRLDSPPCVAPVIGPDNETIYDPVGDRDVCGFFKSHLAENNCYNYGTDIASNTWAQPGRGSHAQYTEITCPNVIQACLSDGLLWAGTETPTRDPPLGHYASLHIYPNRDYHWIRKDTNLETHWSHKAGAVDDVDSNWRRIVDPKTAVMKNWPVQCGYFVVVPSNVTVL